jgi:hypothetical protein|tara:strand:+ start:53 stop:493 length:441 start_codon:yes stop_codon:yes gene_type:complete
MSRRTLGYDVATDSYDPLTKSLKKGMSSIARGIGSLFGINPFTSSYAQANMEARNKSRAREKAAGLEREGLKGDLVKDTTTGKISHMSNLKKGKRITEKEAIKQAQLQASGRRPVFDDGGRRSMNKVNGEKKFNVKKSQTCNQDNC